MTEKKGERITWRSYVKRFERPPPFINGVICLSMFYITSFLVRCGFVWLYVLLWRNAHKAPVQSYKYTAAPFLNTYFKPRLLFAVVHLAMNSAGNCLLIKCTNEQLPALRCLRGLSETPIQTVSICCSSSRTVPRPFHFKKHLQHQPGWYFSDSTTRRNRRIGLLHRIIDHEAAI